MLGILPWEPDQPWNLSSLIPKTFPLLQSWLVFLICGQVCSSVVLGLRLLPGCASPLQHVTYMLAQENSMGSCMWVLWKRRVGSGPHPLCSQPLGPRSVIRPKGHWECNLAVCPEAGGNGFETTSPWILYQKQRQKYEQKQWNKESTFTR